MGTIGKHTIGVFPKLPFSPLMETQRPLQFAAATGTRIGCWIWICQEINTRRAIPYNPPRNIGPTNISPHAG